MSENNEILEYDVIEVPDAFDSLSRIVLNNTVYLIRFTYNDTKDFWKFSLYDSQERPIVLNIKIVPQFPLNLFSGLTKVPEGLFAAFSKLDHIGKDDFKNGNASFIFYSTKSEE